MLDGVYLNGLSGIRFLVCDFVVEKLICFCFVSFIGDEDIVLV